MSVDLIPSCLTVLQVPAGVHAEQPVSALAGGSVWGWPALPHDAVGDRAAQLPRRAALRSQQGSVWPGLPADLQRPTHPHPLRTPAQPAVRPGGLAAHGHPHAPLAGRRRREGRGEGGLGVQEHHEEPGTVALAAARH